MNAKQAMRKMKKQAKQAERERKYPLYYYITGIEPLIWSDEKAAAEYHISHWDSVKEELRSSGSKNLLDAVPISMPSLRKNEIDNLQTDFFNIINEVDVPLMNEKQYHALLSFYQDILDLFDLSDPKYELEWMNCHCGIGEVMHCQGLKEEGYQVFNTLLKDGKNDYIAARYASLLLDDMELDQAKALLADYQASKDDMILERLERLKELQT